MRRFRSFLLLLSAPLLAASISRAQTVLFEDDFEQGASKWTMEDYWHLASQGPPCLNQSIPSGTHCMWYGIESSCNFDGPLVDFRFLRLAAPIALPTGGGGVFLDFWSMSSVESETFWDTRKVRVSTDGGASWTTVFQIDPEFESWTHHTVDLSSYAGQTIDLAFVFWAGDSALNDYLGWLIDDVKIRTAFELYRRSCFGDGTAAACPCGNSSAVGDKAGCLNSLGLGGKLRGSGVASIAHDTLRLAGWDMPNTTVFYYQGASLWNGGMGFAFGDGLSCVAGPIRRLGTTTNSGGESSYPLSGGPSVSVRGQISAPGARWYQARYRNHAADFCTPDTFNSTNVVKVNWAL
ncbi:MAG: choice-of-anchor J domain-containing protein [Planctomycetota bacterium]